MQLVIRKAKKVIEKVKNRWAAAAKGPGAAYLLTCERLGWRVIDATKVETDRGEVLGTAAGSSCCGAEGMP